MAMLVVVALFCWSAVRPLYAQSNSFTVLYNFTAISSRSPTYINSDGVDPVGVVLSDNTLYGTTGMGGSNGEGTVFRVNIDGSSFTNLHTFTLSSFSSISWPEPYTNSDGFDPQGGVIVSGNTLYGTATGGGSNGDGTVFRVNTDGSDFTNLYSFTALYLAFEGSTNSDGALPSAGLILLGNTLYGTTGNGGSGGAGTVFRVNTDGSDFTSMNSFTGDNTGDVIVLPSGGLLLSGDTLFGTTPGAGNSDFYGTVFRVNTNGSDFTNLYSFTNGIDGSDPSSALVLSGNTLYGTAEDGGGAGNGTVFSINTDGSGFTILHSFSAASGYYHQYSLNIDGAGPRGLILSGNTLYGAANGGGSGGFGTLFRMNTDGSAFTLLYSFTALAWGTYTNSDGAGPGGLVLSGNTLYGAAAGGGSGGTGTIFALTLPVPSSGIAQAVNQVVISWPAWAANYALQTAPDLSSGSWSNLTSGIITDGTNYLFTNTPASQTAFFRLQQQ